MESPNISASIAKPLLTDLYQITMSYAYFKNGRHEDRAAFDLFFRKCPFGGEFAVFAGLEEVLRFLEGFRFTDDDLAYLKRIMPQAEDGFFEWLGKLDCSDLEVHAIDEGTIIFPRIPLITVEGPLAVVQLLETALLNLINYATLMATNAVRFRLAAGWDKILFEFGLRRAQGPDGGLSASRYSYIGTFDGTSNVLAGKEFGIPVKGTHAHSFVSAFTSLEESGEGGLVPELKKRALDFRAECGFTASNSGELAAFIAYANAFPEGFLALVDTYDTLASGVPNFICVAKALLDLGYQPIGIRLDSGDLAFLSKEARKMFERFLPGAVLKIAASNDINEAVLYALKDQDHEIDIFGIGTHLVTCQAQPALGAVYKLVEINGQPRIKLSQQKSKITLPGRKKVYRFFTSDGLATNDLMVLDQERTPEPREAILCLHPFEHANRALAIPSRVERLDKLVWRGKRTKESVPAEETRYRVIAGLKTIRPDHLRTANPAEYKVSVSQEAFDQLNRLWLAEAPLSVLS